MADLVHVDPDKLREFSEELRNLSGFLSEQIIELDNELGKLGKTWRDPQFGAFQAEVKKARRKLEAFGEHVAKVRPELDRDADKIAELIRINPRGM